MRARITGRQSRARAAGRHAHSRAPTIVRAPPTRWWQRPRPSQPASQRKRQRLQAMRITPADSHSINGAPVRHNRIIYIYIYIIIYMGEPINTVANLRSKSLAQAEHGRHHSRASLCARAPPGPPLGALISSYFMLESWPPPPRAGGEDNLGRLEARQAVGEPRAHQARPTQWPTTKIDDEAANKMVVSMCQLVSSFTCARVYVCARGQVRAIISPVVRVFVSDQPGTNRIRGCTMQPSQRAHRPREPGPTLARRLS